MYKCMCGDTFSSMSIVYKNRHYYSCWCEKGLSYVKATFGFIALLLLVNRLLLYEYLIRTLHTRNLKVARQQKNLMKDKIYII